MDENLVEIRDLTKIFDKQTIPALDHINATIPRGKMVGLAGPDGAGKTTLIRLIAGLLKPTGGDISVAGFDTIRQAEEIHQITGYMPQRFGLYDDLTVLQNMNLYADLRGVSDAERKDTFEKLLHFTTLEPFTDRLAGQLSGGMKQKLGLACALMQKPTLLLLDEPSVGVDPLSRRELWKMVIGLLHEGITVVWSTAYLDEAEKCDSLILLNEGKLLYYGPPQNLTQRVQGRSFLLTNISGSRRRCLIQALREKNVIDGVIQGRDVRIVIRDPSLPPLAKGGVDAKAVLESTPPRFEDAYVDILGGGPGGFSILAEKTPEVPKKHEMVINAQGLTKRFGTFTAADNITFSVPQGEIFGLLGPNGAGKTTTFRMLCGLLKPTEGKASVYGIDLEEAPSEARSHIGYMAQKFSLYGSLDLKQNLDFFSGIYNLAGKQQREAVQEMIDIFDFKPFLNSTSSSLPLGFKQRLALSCAVMHHPKVLFLDEPTSGVDPITRREFWNHINGLAEKGVTVMVTTHFMDEAEYCDRIGLVYKGKLIKVGSPDELKEQAKTADKPAPTLEDAFVRLTRSL